jgi:hypothetical protein
MGLAGKFLQAFKREGTAFVPTEELNNVINLMQSKTNNPIKIQPAPSVLSGIDGMGMWGSGGGVNYGGVGGTTYVDPIFGDVTVAAHEAAHQAFPSSLATSQNAVQKRRELYGTRMNPEMVDSGAAMRAGYENFGKRALMEEANAQGVAYEAMKQAGYEPNKGGWATMLSYPAEYRFGGKHDQAAPIYKEVFNKPGLATLMPGEMAELSRMNKSFTPAMERQFGYGRSMLR